MLFLQALMHDGCKLEVYSLPAANEMKLHFLLELERLKNGLVSSMTLVVKDGIIWQLNGTERKA